MYIKTTIKKDGCEVKQYIMHSPEVAWEAMKNGFLNLFIGLLIFLYGLLGVTILPIVAFLVNLRKPQCIGTEEQFKTTFTPLDDVKASDTPS